MGKGLLRGLKQCLGLQDKKTSKAEAQAQELAYANYRISQLERALAMAEMHACAGTIAAGNWRKTAAILTQRLASAHRQVRAARAVAGVSAGVAVQWGQTAATERAAREQTEARLADTECQLATLQQRLAVSRAREAELQSRLVITEEDLWVAENGLQASDAQRAQLQAKFERARLRLSEAQLQLTETQSQLAETVTQLAGTQSQLADTQSQLADTQSQLADTQSQLAGTQSQLAASEAEKTEMKQTMERLLARVQELENINTILRARDSSGPITPCLSDKSLSLDGSSSLSGHSSLYNTQAVDGTPSLYDTQTLDGHSSLDVSPTDGHSEHESHSHTYDDNKSEISTGHTCSQPYMCGETSDLPSCTSEAGPTPFCVPQHQQQAGAVAPAAPAATAAAAAAATAQPAAAAVPVPPAAATPAAAAAAEKVRSGSHTCESVCEIDCVGSLQRSAADRGAVVSYSGSHCVRGGEITLDRDECECDIRYMMKGLVPSHLVDLTLHQLSHTFPGQHHVFHTLLLRLHSAEHGRMMAYGLIGALCKRVGYEQAVAALRLRAAAEAHEEEVKQWRSTVALADERLAETQQLHSSAEAAAARLAAQLAAVAQEGDLQQLYVDTCSQLNQLSAELVQLRADYNELLQTAGAELLQLQQQLADTQQQLEQSQQGREQLVQASLNALLQLQQQLADTQQQLEQSQQGSELLTQVAEQQLAAAEQDKLQLHSQLDDTQQQLGAVRTAYDQLMQHSVAEMLRLENQLAAAQSS